MESNLTPYDEDDVVVRAADSVGLEVIRHDVLDIDATALPAIYKRLTPDYRKIREHLAIGVNIPGVRETGLVEFLLRRRPNNG